MKTNELTGAALDWAVQIAEGYVQPDPIAFARNIFKPSTEWKQGGPIIERERLSVSEIPPSLGSGWNASKPASTPVGYKTWASGPTPLIAAMRCYVASKLGDDIEIPKELL